MVLLAGNAAGTCRPARAAILRGDGAVVAAVVAAADWAARTTRPLQPQRLGQLLVLTLQLNALPALERDALFQLLVRGLHAGLRRGRAVLGARLGRLGGCECALLRLRLRGLGGQRLLQGVVLGGGLVQSGRGVMLGVLLALFPLAQQLAELICLVATSAQLLVVHRSELGQLGLGLRRHAAALRLPALRRALRLGDTAALQRSLAQTPCEGVLGALPRAVLLSHAPPLVVELLRVHFGRGSRQGAFDLQQLLHALPGRALLANLRFQLLRQLIEYLQPLLHVALIRSGGASVARRHEELARHAIRRWRRRLRRGVRGGVRRVLRALALEHVVHGAELLPGSLSRDADRRGERRHRGRGAPRGFYTSGCKYRCGRRDIGRQVDRGKPGIRSRS